MSKYIENAKRSAYDSLSNWQKDFIVENLGKKTRLEIAQSVKIPEVRLKRAASYAGWSFTYKKAVKYRKYSKELVRLVIDEFEKNGIGVTEDKFPDISVRSIVEGYPRNKSRQSRWTFEQLLEAMKMGPFVSFEKQARFFNRPRANKGSIVSLWQKNLKCKPMDIHGMAAHRAKIFVKDSCPSIRIKRGEVFLWSDMVKHLEKDCPKDIRESFLILADFQKSLFRNEPRVEIINLINERECQRKK